MHDVWFAVIEQDGITGMDFIKEHNSWLTLGQGHYKLSFIWNVAEYVGEEHLLLFAQVVAWVTSVISPFWPN